MPLRIASLLLISSAVPLPPDVLYPRGMLLIIAAVFSFVYFLFKRLKWIIPDLIGTGIMIPIFEEIFFKILFLDLVLLRILAQIWVIQIVPAFYITTVFFVIIHPILTAETSPFGRLLRLVDAIYIGIMCGSFFLMSFPHDGGQIFFVIGVCIAIHMAFNIAICFVKAFFLLKILFMVLRIALCLLYIWQAATFIGDWRAILIPFFLHGVL